MTQTVTFMERKIMTPAEKRAKEEFHEYIMSDSYSEHPNQFMLLKQRRFAPYFWTQFLGAMNDNAFKFAFTVMVTYQLSLGWLPAQMAGLVIGALFILPYLIFSATSGQIADKYNKANLMRTVKNLEIAIMLVACAGFMYENVPVLLGCVFLMGLHSTLFGPVKFAYLPQVLKDRELTGGNGMVEMGTFVAILSGNVLGGLLVAIPYVGHEVIAVTCLGLAVAGRLVSHKIMDVPVTAPDLKINWNPFTETMKNLRLAKKDIAVFRSILGISWMWFLGAVFLGNFPVLAKDVLHGNEHVASLLLVVFSVGIAAGSLLCENLSRRSVDIGLVPFGAIGMSVFCVHLYYALNGVMPSPSGNAYGLLEFLSYKANWVVLVDLMMFSLCTGLFIVPMYSLIQMRSDPAYRARVIAANNILNSLFMIASSLFAAILLWVGLDVPQLFLVAAVAHVGICIYIFLLVPEYLFRFTAWMLTHCLYRFKVTGASHIPDKGACVLASNHVTFVDALLLLAASPRPIYFIMDHKIFRIPILGWLFRLVKAIPVAPKHEDEEAYQKAMSKALKVLEDGDILAIFPEGKLTKDGQLGEFKSGIMKIINDHPAPVIPMALVNMWGSFFSRIENGSAMKKPFRRGFFTSVGLNIGEPIDPEELTIEYLKDRIYRLGK